MSVFGVFWGKRGGGRGGLKMMMAVVLVWRRGEEFLEGLFRTRFITCCISRVMVGGCVCPLGGPILSKSK